MIPLQLLAQNENAVGRDLADIVERA